jgi:hypothetical protein
VAGFRGHRCGCGHRHLRPRLGIAVDLAMASSRTPGNPRARASRAGEGGSPLRTSSFQSVAGKTVAAGVSPAICMPRRICNAEPCLLFYFFLRDSMTPSAMHCHLPLRSIQVSTQT